LASFDRALALRPDDAEAHINRGNALRELKRIDEALASYDRAIAVRPDYVEAFNNRSVMLQELRQFDEALASLDRALALRPDYVEGLTGDPHAILRRIDVGEETKNPVAVGRARRECIDVRQIVARTQPRRASLLLERAVTRVVEFPFAGVRRQQPA